MATSSIGHARTPGILADIAVGWMNFLRFAKESGVLTEVDKERMVEDVWNTLAQLGTEQQIEIADQDPVFRFLKLLNTTLVSGRAHVTNRDGGQPADPEMWGWRVEDVGPSDSPSHHKPQGRQVGWVDNDDLFLDPEAAYAEVQRLGEDQGDRLAVSKSQLSRHIKEANLLRNFEPEKTTSRRTLQGRERAVLHLSVGSLLPPKTGGTGGTGSQPQKDGEKGSDLPPCSSPEGGKQGETTGGFAPERVQNRTVPPVPPVSGREGVPL